MENRFSPSRRKVLAVSSALLGGLVLAGRVTAGAGDAVHGTDGSDGALADGVAPSSPAAGGMTIPPVVPEILSAQDLIGKRLRVAKEGDPLTMDYSPERVTITVDEAGHIQSVRIG